MSIFKKNEKKNDNRLPMPDKVKRGYRWYCSLVATVALMGCCTMTAFAADDLSTPTRKCRFSPKWNVIFRRSA